MNVLNIAGGGEQHAGALQVPRHVGLVRAEDLLESRPGLPGSGQDPEGPFQKRCAGDADQSRQRDTVAKGPRLPPEEVRSPEAAEKSRRGLRS